jgi:hypothetical protein
MTYHRVCNKSNTTGATRGAGTTSAPKHLDLPRFYTFYSKVKRKKRMSSTLDEYVYEDIIDTEDTKAKSQSSCLDSLQPGKRNSTILVSGK